MSQPGVPDTVHGGKASARAAVMQQKARQPVMFARSQQTGGPVSRWIEEAIPESDDALFRGRFKASSHVSTSLDRRAVGFPDRS